MIATRPARIACLAPLLFAAAASAADRVTSPVYKSWEAFKPGAMARYRQVSEVGPTKFESTMTYTLVERTADKVVVEMQVTTRSNGAETKNRPMRMDNPRWMTLPAGMKADQVGKAEGVTDEGTDDVKLAGLDLKARWYKAKTKVERGDTFTQSWSSDAVPGGLVKSLTTTPVTKSSMSMELIEVKAP